MKFLSLKLAVSVCLGSLCVVGCGGPEKPDGLPELTPCRLILTQDGEPLADATARFVYQGDGDVGRWAVAGVSNDKGVVEMLTHGQFKGAPSGRYAVVVTKEAPEEDGETSKIYSLVASEFTSQTTTPSRKRSTWALRRANFSKNWRLRPNLNRAALVATLEKRDDRSRKEAARSSRGRVACVKR